MMNRFRLALVLCTVGLMAVNSGANANVVYAWETLSATLNGSPTAMTASGQITLTDAGFLQGSAQLTSNFPPFSVTHSFNGIDSVSFQMFNGPLYAISTTSLTNVLFNLSVTRHNQISGFLRWKPGLWRFCSRYKRYRGVLRRRRG